MWKENRPAYRRSELILVKGRRAAAGGVGKSVARVKIVIANKFVCRTVKMSGARLAGDVNDPTQYTAVLRVGIVRNYLKLLNGINAGQDRVSRGPQVRIDYSIQVVQ